MYNKPMAKSSKINSLLLIIIFVLIFATAMTVLLSSNTDTTFAQVNQTNFDILFPSNHYIQLSNPTYIAKSSEYLAIYDETEKVILTIDTNNSQKIIDVSNYYPLKNLFILDNVVLIQYTVNNTTTYSKYNIETSTSFEEVTFTAPQEGVQAMASDGSLLYVKSLDGHMALYDSSFNVHATMDGSLDCLYGKAVRFAGHNEKIASFAVDEQFELSIATISTKAINANSLAGSSLPKSVDFNGTYVFAYYDATQTFSVYSANTAEKIFDYEFSLDQFVVFGNDIYIINEDKIYIYNVNNDVTSLILRSYFAKVGNDVEHLNAPKAAQISGDYLYIADTNNNRVLIYDYVTDSYVTQITCLKPEDIVYVSNKKWFVLSSNKIIEFEKTSQKAEYSLGENFTIKSITWMGKLYILATDGMSTSVYVLYAGSFYKLFTVNNATDITSTQDGSFIYVLSGSVGSQIITCYDDKGTKSLVELNLNDVNAKKIQVDTVGNLYVLTSEYHIMSYTRQAVSYDKKEELNFTNDIYKININSFSLAPDNKVIFSNNDSFIGIADMEHVDSITPTPAPDISNSSVKIYKTNATTLFFIEPNSLEDAIIVDENVLIPVFENASQVQNLLYGYYDGKFGYFNVSFLTLQDETDAADSYLVTIVDNVRLYKFPFETAEYKTVGQNYVVRFLNNVSDFDNARWYKIETNDNKVYYILRESVTLSENDEPTDTPKYGKAQAKRIGGQINLYSTPNDNSDVIMKISDGQKMEIYDEISGYYYVNYNGHAGYTKVDDVKLSGLTSTQKIGIILAVLAIAAGGAIFVSTNLARKKNKNQ